MNRLVALFLIFCISFFACSDLARSGWGTLAGKTAQKLALQKLRQRLSIECAEFLFKKEIQKISNLGVKNIDELAFLAGHSAKKVSAEIASSPKLYKKLDFNASAVAFGIKHGIPGRILLKHVPLNVLKNSKWLDLATPETVKQAANLCQPGVAGSWKKLATSLRTNDFNRGERDVCEYIFKRAVEVGKIPELKGGTILEGHGTLGRGGIDFISVSKEGKFQIIEFGTSKKPYTGEMSWTRIRDRLSKADFQPDTLGSLGVGPEKRLQLQKALENGNDEQLSACVQRIVAAPDFAKAKLVDGPGDILALQLY